MTLTVMELLVLLLIATGTELQMVQSSLLIY